MLLVVARFSPDAGRVTEGEPTCSASAFFVFVGGANSYNRRWCVDDIRDSLPELGDGFKTQDATLRDWGKMGQWGRTPPSRRTQQGTAPGQPLRQQGRLSFWRWSARFTRRPSSTPRRVPSMLSSSTTARACRFSELRRWPAANSRRSSSGLTLRRAPPPHLQTHPPWRAFLRTHPRCRVSNGLSEEGLREGGRVARADARPRTHARAPRRWLA